VRAILRQAARRPPIVRAFSTLFFSTLSFSTLSFSIMPFSLSKEQDRPRLGDWELSRQVGPRADREEEVGGAGGLERFIDAGKAIRE
jgi:hypothetical protein